MSFIVIWDTCASPEYYADLHNVLALPEEFIVRYEYTKKRFDIKSLKIFEKLINKQISDINVVLFYGQTAEYQKGGNPPRSEDRVSKIVPFRRGVVVGATCLENESDDQESKIVYDIKLLSYPSPDRFEQLKVNFNKITKDRVPFKYWHTYIDDNTLETALIKESDSNSNSNWRSIVDKLHACQFKNDSFWHIDIASTTKNSAFNFCQKCKPPLISYTHN